MEERSVLLRAVKTNNAMQQRRRQPKKKKMRSASAERERQIIGPNDGLEVMMQNALKLSDN
jgi:hypothetical protein